MCPVGSINIYARVHRKGCRQFTTGGSNASRKPTRMGKKGQSWSGYGQQDSEGQAPPTRTIIRRLKLQIVYVSKIELAR